MLKQSPCAIIISRAKARQGFVPSDRGTSLTPRSPMAGALYTDLLNKLNLKLRLDAESPCPHRAHTIIELAHRIETLCNEHPELAL